VTLPTELSHVRWSFWYITLEMFTNLCTLGMQTMKEEILLKLISLAKKTNLHAVWDTSIIVKWNNNLDSAVEYLENMIKQEPDLVDKYLSDMNPVDWATESHGYVISTVYNYTSKSNIAQIGQEYYDTNLPIIEQRLIAAGVRLAQLLTTLLS